ncbi:hypothetical protein Micbo1qcDRAFT_200450 [Microdochium bolleyi]|uniref:Uncharacterized protein n=1 Tax=Microdochium bolleyi TaxID=196109 RepID=A0A136JCW6_9PEZI|nr:hypothetical protein Micbo1qcDRAFT_200450 [Microdochium bolleyi]
MRIFLDVTASMLMEICWLLASVVWGTLKIFNSRKFVSREIREAESQWTFGQLLPVLLLLAAVFTALNTAVSVYTESGIPRALGQAECAGAASSIGTGTGTAWKPQQASALLLGQVTEIEVHGSDSSVSTAAATGTENAAQDAAAGYDLYSTEWLLPCLAAEIAVVAYIVTQGFITLGVGTSFVEGWIQYGMLTFVLLGVPLASTLSLSVTLALDPLFNAFRRSRSRSRSRRRLRVLQLSLFLLSALYYIFYALVYLHWFYGPFEGRTSLGVMQGARLGIGLGLTVVLYILYLSIARWAQSGSFRSLAEKEGSGESHAAFAAAEGTDWEADDTIKSRVTIFRWRLSLFMLGRTI